MRNSVVCAFDLLLQFCLVKILFIFDKNFFQTKPKNHSL